MDRKPALDAFGVTALTLFALLLAFNQVVIKVSNGGFQPVFFAGIRSVGAALVVLVWIRLRGIPFRIEAAVWRAGAISGAMFAAEFLCLFVALDLTTVARAGIFFYSMPVWMALVAHVILPGERLTARRSLGLAVAVAGVAIALTARDPSGEASLWGDLAAIGGAVGWAATATMSRASALSRVRPEVQLWLNVLISGPILIAVAPIFGPLIRELEPIHLWGLAFQIVVVVSAGFIFWLWLLSIYPASGVASFSFLSPVFSVLLGWALLDEHVGPQVIVALVLVAAGLILINRAPRQVPQKV